MIGIIHRVMRFQFFARLNGITGWIFITFWVRSAEPIPKLKFSWMGTLMRLAMGFCDCFLNSSAFEAAAGVASVATEVPSGPTGVSCVNAGMTGKKTNKNEKNNVRMSISIFL
jgi:hypothetical protein